MTEDRKKYQEQKISNRGDVYVFDCEFPKENPDGVLKDIVDCLDHIGMFDGIDKNSIQN